MAYGTLGWYYCWNLDDASCVRVLVKPSLSVNQAKKLLSCIPGISIANIHILSVSLFMLCVDKKPTISQLQYMDISSKPGEGLRVIETLQADWTKLARSFGLSETFIRNLQRARQEDDFESCTAVFNSWLGGEGDEAQRTWNTVISVISKTGRYNQYKSLISEITRAVEELPKWQWVWPYVLVSDWELVL